MHAALPSDSAVLFLASRYVIFQPFTHGVLPLALEIFLNFVGAYSTCHVSNLGHSDTSCVVYLLFCAWIVGRGLYTNGNEGEPRTARVSVAVALTVSLLLVVLGVMTHQRGT